VFRRAEENTSVKGQTSRELDAYCRRNKKEKENPQRNERKHN